MWPIPKCEIIIPVLSSQYGSVLVVDGFISCHLSPFRGPLQNFKIHMGMEIGNTIHKTDNIICLRSQEVKSV
jgi:hypothetical protein